MKKNSCLDPVTKMLKSNDNWMISWYELTSFKSWCQLYCHIPELSYPQWRRAFATRVVKL